MSPASRSKSKDNKSGKGSPKPSGLVNISNGTPASGYNPVLGTFYTFETAPVPSVSPLQVNGRFQNIDERDDHSGNSSWNNGIECDSISNNGSCSGESEDQKEKPSHQLHLRQDTIPGADNEKREKIRQKNERKHQRQKERRAQELHERCNGYLMSRKLEALAQELLDMGFCRERATMALILNEGRLEESVAWILEGGEENTKMEHNLDGGGNLKIDISKELARITEFEIRYKASKQEVERAVVSCEGDLDKAEETIKAQKEEPPTVSPKPEENGDSSTLANNKSPVGISHSSLRIILPQCTSSTTVPAEKRDDRDFNYTKVPVTMGSSVDPGAKSVHILKKTPVKSDCAKQQQIAVPAEKRRLTARSYHCTSISVASPIPPKTDACYVSVGNESLKNLQLGSVKQPVIVMQRRQSTNAKQAPSTSISSSPPRPTTMGCYPGSVETANPHGFGPSVPVPGSYSLSGQLFGQPHHQLSQQHFMSSTKRLNGCWGGGGSPSLAPPSSLGLFSGIGASGASSQVDWSTGSSMLQLDYTNIDWSLDRGPRPNSFWSEANYIQQHYGPYTTRSALSNGNGATISPNDPTDGEWFEEKDVFSLPRQFVSSPSL